MEYSVNTTEGVYSNDTAIRPPRPGFYGYPVILAIGSVGNIIAYSVFTRTSFRKISSLQYLAAIAVTDTGFLWTFILNHLYSDHNVPLIVQAGLCQLMTFLNYVFTFLSIWFLVTMVVEKFIGVYWPLKKATMCTPFRAKLVMFFMAAFAMACYSYIGYFVGPNTFHGVLQCMRWHELHEQFDKLTKIDTVVVAMLPYGTIIILTSLIVIRGCEYYQISAAVELWPRHTGTGNNTPQTTLRVTCIIFPVIAVTVISSLPIMILRSITVVFELLRGELLKWQATFYDFYILTFALKCLVYVIFSGNFRRKLFDLLKSGCRRLKHTCKGDSSEAVSDAQMINLNQLAPGCPGNAIIEKTDV